MQIWVDADACPRVIKEILFRAADRKKVRLTLVANQPIRTPASPYINSMVVGAGFERFRGRTELTIYYSTQITQQTRSYRAYKPIFDTKVEPIRH